MPTEERHIFFTIQVPKHWDGTEREWADKYWDTYGFDYDTQKCSNGRIVAWPCNDEDDEVIACKMLKHALEDGDLEYETFLATYDHMFGSLTE